MKLLLLTALAAYSAHAQDGLAQLLAQLDKNARVFEGATASVRYTTYNAAVDADTVTSGTIAMKRSGAQNIRALVRLTEPTPKQIFVGNGVADIYTPRLQLVQEYDITGGREALFQQLYLIGFGGSGKELAANYHLTLIGNDTVSEARTTHLQLLPKSPDLQKNFTKIEMWLSTPAAYPAQIRFTTPAGDTTTVLYSNLKINGHVSDGDLKLKTPNGVKKEKVR